MLDINKLEEWGGETLRKAIQECNHCHLSVAVLRKRGSDDDRGDSGDDRRYINIGIDNAVKWEV